MGKRPAGTGHQGKLFSRELATTGTHGIRIEGNVVGALRPHTEHGPFRFPHYDMEVASRGGYSVVNMYVVLRILLRVFLCYF